MNDTNKIINSETIILLITNGERSEACAKYIRDPRPRIEFILHKHFFCLFGLSRGVSTRDAFKKTNNNELQHHGSKDRNLTQQTHASRLS